MRPVSSTVLAAVLASLALPAVAERPRNVPDKEEPINEGLDPAPKDLDRSTPLRSWSAFVEACRASRAQLAVHVLHVGELALADRKQLGPVLAQQLCDVLKTNGQLSTEGLDDTPLGPLVDEKPANYVVVVTVHNPATGPEDLWLRRLYDTLTQQHVWVVTKQSVSQIPAWYHAFVKKEQVRRADADSLNKGLGALPVGLKVGSPRDAVQRFLSLYRAGDFAGAARLLDLTGIEESRQPAEGARLARRLALVLKRLKPAGYGLLTNDPAGAPEQDVSVDEEVVARAPADDRDAQVRLVRYPRAAAKPVWLFSPETVGSVDQLYGRVGYGWAGDHLPPLFFDWEVGGVQLWQWLGLVAALAAGLLAGWLLSMGSKGILRRLAALTSWGWDDELVRAAPGPLTVLYTVLCFVGFSSWLSLAEAPRALLLSGAGFVAILGAGWFLVRMIDVAGEALSVLFKNRHDELGTAMVPDFRKILKPIAVALVLIVALQNAGMNVAGLLAGLGIGGLAIAMAGKTTLENLFGSIAIAFDRPFKIGDVVRVGDLNGTVEDVGLRSTRLRTLDRTIVTIPNNQMADSKVENFSKRDRLRLVTRLSVAPDTSVDQLKLILDEAKRCLLRHPTVWQNDFDVRLVGFSGGALEIELSLYVDTLNWGVYAATREELFMELGSIVAAAGARLASPTHTLVTTKESTGPSEKALKAADLVAQLAKAGELCVPEIPAGVREKERKRASR
ncbi:MAG: mechanosensitive ion channel family protein [Deltaproteobacteria bacterium]|nr:mechanosensitive ion channel family protein [Deltaproteobacteria bacterium]